MLEAPPEPPPADVAKRRMLRVAWSIVAGGFLIAFGAAVVGGSSPDTDVTFARELAGVIALAGLILALVAHRAARLRILRQQRDFSTRSGEHRGTYSMFRFFLVGLPAIIGAVVVIWGILVLIPPLIGGLVISLLTLLLPVVLLTIAVHGKGYGATFCLGALVPMFARLLGFVMGNYWLPMSRSTSGPRILEFLGQTQSTTALIWLGAVVAGAVAVGTRALVERGLLVEDVE